MLAVLLSTSTGPNRCVRALGFGGVGDGFGGRSYSSGLQQVGGAELL